MLFIPSAARDLLREYRSRFEKVPRFAARTSALFVVAYRVPGAYTRESCACWMYSSTGSGRGTTGHELGVN